ncbi:hypothetical protein ABEF93_000113 [Exophiala dermatitidis]
MVLYLLSYIFSDIASGYNHLATAAERVVTSAGEELERWLWESGVADSLMALGTVHEEEILPFVVLFLCCLVFVIGSIYFQCTPDPWRALQDKIDNRFNAEVARICWFARVGGILVKFTYTHIVKVVYDRWVRDSVNSVCSRLVGAPADIPTPEPGFIPGGFPHFDVDDGDARDVQAQKDKQEEDTRRRSKLGELATELGDLRATVASLAEKLAEANKQAKEAEDRRVFCTTISGNSAPQKAPPSPRVSQAAVETIHLLQQQLAEMMEEAAGLRGELAAARAAVEVVAPAPVAPVAVVVVDTVEIGVQTDLPSRPSSPLPETEEEAKAVVGVAPVVVDTGCQTDDLPLEVASVVAEKATQTVVDNNTTVDTGVQTDPEDSVSEPAVPVVPASVLESRDAEVRSLKADSERLRGEIQSITGELATAQNAVIAKGQELTESRERFTALDHAYQQTVATLTACDQARQEAVARVNELQTANSQGNQELARAREALEAASASNLQLQERFQAGRSQFEAGKAQFDELKRKYDEAVAEKAAQTSSFAEERARLVAGRVQLDTEVKTLRERLGGVEWAGKKLAKELHEVQEASSKKDAQLAALKAQLEPLRAQTTPGASVTTTAVALPAAAAAAPTTPAGRQQSSSPTSRASSAAGVVGGGNTTPRLGESPLMGGSRTAPRGAPESLHRVIGDLTRRVAALTEEKKKEAEAKDDLLLELELLKELHKKDDEEAQAELDAARARLDQHRAEIGEMQWQLRTREIDLAVATSKADAARSQYEASKEAVGALEVEVGNLDPERRAATIRKGKRVARDDARESEEAKRAFTEDDRHTGMAARERDALYATASSSQESPGDQQSPEDEAEL